MLLPRHQTCQLCCVLAPWLTESQKHIEPPFPHLQSRVMWASRGGCDNATRETAVESLQPAGIDGMLVFSLIKIATVLSTYYTPSLWTSPPPRKQGPCEDTKGQEGYRAEPGGGPQDLARSHIHSHASVGLEIHR